MTADIHQLQCLEVWGGNDESSRGVRMYGLDAWLLSRPSGGDASGGDIHYVSSCSSGMITRMLLADVAGHGTTVSDVALRLRTLMRRNVQRRDQDVLIGAINAEFAAISDDGRFATALIATHWAPTGEVDVTLAGHPPPMIRRGGGAWTALEPEVSAPHAAPGNIPLGVIDTATYRSTRVRLGDGDTALFYTDGIVEARSPQGEMLGYDGLARLLASEPLEPAETFVERLYARVQAFAGRAEPEDDSTLLLVRRNRASLTRGLAARVLRTPLNWVREKLERPGLPRASARPA
ncbi:MAG: PP2C family protein-serine/threonine phosphatase [Planctomycetota bacterium]|nr:PP2C family protein-serine/threonine phosphatase [Planctomycetota bacterium]